MWCLLLSVFALIACLPACLPACLLMPPPMPPLPPPSPPPPCRNELQNPSCAARVHRVIAATTRDVSFNHPLAEACTADRQRLCARVPHGSAGVMRCLVGQRESLSPACAAMLFDTQVAMAENIDYNWPLKKACNVEIELHCGGVQHGRARVYR
jgi:Golgi apparatus protein 1